MDFPTNARVDESDKNVCTWWDRKDSLQSMKNWFLSFVNGSARGLRKFLLLRRVRMTKKRLYAISADYTGQWHVDIFLQTVSTTLEKIDN